MLLRWVRLRRISSAHGRALATRAVQGLQLQGMSCWARMHAPAFPSRKQQAVLMPVLYLEQPKLFHPVGCLQCIHRA